MKRILNAPVETRVAVVIVVAIVVFYMIIINMH